MFKKLQAIFRPPVNTVRIDPFDETLNQLAQLYPPVFETIHSAYWSTVTVEVLFSPISAYTKQLEHSISYLSNERRIQPHDYAKAPSVIFISHFFLGQDGRYGYEVDNLTAFITAATAFLEAYQKANAEINDVSDRNYCLLVLGKQAQNLAQLIATLSRIS